MKALTDQQSVRARDWIRALGEQTARNHTAAELAQMLNQVDGTDCFTPAHMAARRQQVFPLQERKPDRVAQLEKDYRELARRLENLERMVQQMRQGSFPLPAA